MTNVAAVLKCTTLFTDGLLTNLVLRYFGGSIPLKLVCPLVAGLWHVRSLCRFFAVGVRDIMLDGARLHASFLI